MKKTIAKIIKQFSSNKEIFTKSLHTSISSLLKMFLLHKLQQMKFFKPFRLIFRLIIKWSAYTSIFSLVYSIIAKIFSFQYDMTFWFSIIYGLWLVISEGLMEYLTDKSDALFSYIKKLFAKVYFKLSSNSNTLSEAEKLKLKFLEADDLRESNNRLRKGKEAIGEVSSKLNNIDNQIDNQNHNSLVGTATPDYKNLPSSSYWDYAFYGACAAGFILGGYVLYSYFNGDTTTLNYYWDKVKGGGNYLLSYIPDGIKNFVWKKYGLLVILNINLLMVWMVTLILIL